MRHTKHMTVGDRPGHKRMHSAHGHKGTVKHLPKAFSHMAAEHGAYSAPAPEDPNLPDSDGSAEAAGLAGQYGGVTSDSVPGA